MTENGTERPYKPSWIDRFTDWVGTLPLPGWAFYGGLGLGLIVKGFDESALASESPETAVNGTE